MLQNNLGTHPVLFDIHYNNSINIWRERIMAIEREKTPYQMDMHCGTISRWIGMVGHLWVVQLQGIEHLHNNRNWYDDRK